MRKKVFCVIGFITVLILVYFIGSGFLKNPSVFINAYEVSADGEQITIDVGVSGSVGYIRDVAVHQLQGEKLYLDFYSAFGGINGSVGAKNRFTIRLNEEISIIGVYRNANCYEEVLLKAEDGFWQRTMKK